MSIIASLVFPRSCSMQIKSDDGFYLLRKRKKKLTTNGTNVFNDYVYALPFYMNNHLSSET